MKKLRNNTAADILITDTGINLLANSLYIIAAGDYALFAQSSDIITQVGSGNITVNDGSFDLSKADAISLLQGNFKQSDMIPSLKENNRIKVDVLFSGDQLLKVSSDDQSLGYIESKIVGKATETQTAVLNNGSSESFQIGLANYGTAATYGTASQVPVINTDTKGRVTASNLNIAITTSQIIDFASAIENAISSINILTVRTDPSFGEYSSIAAACTSITNASSSNPYLVEVGPGVFVEPVINVPSYVSVKGSSINSTVVTPLSPNQHCFILHELSEVSFLNVLGHADSIGSGYAAFYTKDCGNFVQLHKISIYGMDIGFDNYANTMTSVLYSEYCDINGNYTYAVRNRGTGTFIAKCQLENFYSYPSTTVGSIVVYSEGINAELAVTVAGLQGDPIVGSGIVLSNGGYCDIAAVSMSDMGVVGLKTINSGSGPSLNANSLTFSNCFKHIKIENPATTGSLQGSFDSTKIEINNSSNISLDYSDLINGGAEIIGPLRLGTKHSNATDVTDLIQLSSPIGVLFGGVISKTANALEVSISAGYGYLIDSTTLKLKKVSWGVSLLTLPNATNNFVYVNNLGVITRSTSIPSISQSILLARARTTGGVVVIIAKIPYNAENSSTHIDQFARTALGPIYVSGSIVSENSSTARALNISSGSYWFSRLNLNPTGGTVVPFTRFYRTAGVLSEVGGVTVVDNTSYDNGTNLTALTAGYFTKHVLYITGDGANESYSVVQGQAEFSTLLAAQQASLPTPPSFFGDITATIAAIIVQQGVANFSQIIDIRPRIGFQSPSTTAAASHGGLLGLLNDDHTQYTLVTGSRAFTGNIDMGANSITNVNLVDGVDISIHAARHLPNGADPLTTAAPTTALSAATVNTVGIQNSLARSDHSHAISSSAAIAQIPDQTSAIGTSSNFARADHVHNIATGTPSSIGVLNSQGSSIAFARQDHIHNHGIQTDATHHAPASTLVNGFMSATDKVKLDGLQAGMYLLSTTTYSTINNLLPTTISDLQLNIVSGKVYKFKYMLRYTAAATTTGIALSIAGTSTGTIIAQATAAITATTTQSLRLNAFSQVLTFTSTPSTTTELVIIEGIFVCTASGTFYPDFRTGTIGSQVRVLNNSLLEYREM